MKKSSLYPLFTGCAIGYLLLTLVGLFSNDALVVVVGVANAFIITVLLQIGAYVDVAREEEEDTI